MTSIMSTTGDPSVGQAEPEAAAALLTPPPTDRDEAVARSVQAVKAFGSKRYFDAERTAARAGEAFDRSFYPEGAPRQLAGVIASGDRSERLADLTTPTLVIHGCDDTLINPSGGLRTAELVPGSKLLLLKDMGHDLPEPLWPFVVEVIGAHTRS
jgi:pimeloyl-ACP methyl ester carboxylesterase